MATEAREYDAMIVLCRGDLHSVPTELDRIVSGVRAASAYAQVRGAFVDHCRPSLVEVLDDCVTTGATRLLIVPVVIPALPSLRRWLPQAVRRWARHLGRPGVEVVLAAPLGDTREIVEAVLDVAAGVEGASDLRVDAPKDRGNPAWSQIPSPIHHVLACTGPRCMMSGAGELWDRLGAALKERGLDRRDGGIRVARTTCLYPCNRGPLMLVQPEGIWYCYLNEGAIDRIVEEHFIGGAVVEKYARTPETAST